MPHLNYLRDEMGHAAIEPQGRFSCGSHQTFTLTYTAGKFGIDDTGSIKVAMRQQGDTGAPQLTDPSAANYVTVSASNGAVLKVTYDTKLNIRPYSKVLHIRVVKGFLREGDQITITYGDTSGGGPGIRLQTFVEPRFEFRVFVDAFATYQFAELPDPPHISVVPGPPQTWRAVLPTLRRSGDTFRLCLKAEDAWGNPSDRIDTTVALRASLPVDGLPAEAAIATGDYTAILEGLSVSEPGDLTIDVLDGNGQVLARSNPLRIVGEADLVHYWSDHHGQSGETVGTNSARMYFEFARDKAFLDVTGHQGNDFQIDKAFWKELNALTAEFDEPGRFVALPGYEWSGNTGMGGDHNVYYRHEGETIHRSSHVLLSDYADTDTDCHTINDLYAALDGKDAIVQPHIGGRYADIAVGHDPRIEHSVEIHSSWGTFEWAIRKAFDLGYRMGIVCNSDGHKGRPGASYPGPGSFGAIGGLTCLLMDKLDRQSVFDTLRARRHYGTTGARLFLDVRLRLDNRAERFLRDPVIPGAEADIVPADEALMGDIVRSRDPEATLVVDIIGSAPLERLELRNGTETLALLRPYQPDELGRRVRVIWEGAEYEGRGRMTTWDGNASVQGNSIETAAPVNFLNPEKRLTRDGDSLSWQSNTTGNFAGFDLCLAQRDAGELRIETPHVSETIAIADIGYEDIVLDAGGLDRRVRVFRLPDENSHTAMRIEHRVSLADGRDNPFYVALTQEDGHRAWSSPIYAIA